MIIVRMNPSDSILEQRPPSSGLPNGLASSGSVRLSDWGVIRAVGAEAAAFLQGQLTNDVESLDAHQARVAGYCSAKGRLLATFMVWRPASDEFLLACGADVLAATLKRLSMFVLRAKCKLTDASADVGLHGLWGHAVEHDAKPFMVRDGLIHLAPVAGLRRAWRISGSAQAEPPGAAPVEDEDAWRWMEVASGLPRITANTSDAYVPQMVNLELVGGVSFKKGCYPGQEIVARSQYRGTLKRRMHLFSASAPAQPGQEVFHASDPEQPVGTVVNAATSHGNTTALISLKSAVLHEAQPTHLALGAADGPSMEHRILPYPVPDEATD